MKVFRKEKYIKSMGVGCYEIQKKGNNWVDKCDGKPVKDGKVGCLFIHDTWCIDVPEPVNCRCVMKEEKKAYTAKQPAHARYKITIECDGTTTTARMEVNGKEVKTAQAKRNPADKFSWRVGAETAFGRLWDNEEKKEKKEKKERPFKVGDRVVCIKPTDEKESTVGKKGRVIGNTDFRFVSVEFDEYIDGHDCLGLGKKGYCWNCMEETLRHE